MIDLLPYVAEKVAETGAQVELQYNGFDATFPLVIITETGNISEFIADNEEIYSNISIQCDCYHNSAADVRGLAADVSAAMIAAGFRRTGGRDLAEDGIYRYSLTFSTTANENTERLFRGR